jgi:hypothetical protein
MLLSISLIELHGSLPWRTLYIYIVGYRNSRQKNKKILLSVLSLPSQVHRTTTTTTHHGKFARYQTSQKESVHNGNFSDHPSPLSLNHVVDSLKKMQESVLCCFVQKV